jgi:hypothetical protein
VQPSESRCCQGALDNTGGRLQPDQGLLFSCPGSSYSALGTIQSLWLLLDCVCALCNFTQHVNWCHKFHHV